MSEFIYRGKKIKSVGIFGLGKSNEGVIRYLKKHYPNLTFTLRQNKPFSEQSAYDFDKIFVGENALLGFDEDIIFLSPTVRRDKLPKEVQKITSSDAEFFLENTRSEAFVVTGSDGKSTTTTLTALLLSVGGEKIPAIGNIGVAMTPHLDSNISRVVTELSSFQLMNFAPKSRRALITNISPNHLDFHTSYDEYKWAKTNALKEADEQILNFDCEVCRGELSFERLFGVYSQRQDYRELSKAVRAEVYVTLKDGIIRLNDREIFDTGAMKCKNRHTVCNLMASIALTHGYTTDEQILRVGREFSGLRHRCEFIGTFAGVTYVNSSIDSTPTRTATTLSSFAGGLVVILGGKGKGLDYRVLIPEITDKARVVILTGANADEIEEVLLSDSEFLSKEIPLIRKSDFRDAVLTAIGCSERGDTVILSPASTSFDSFQNFEERGFKFKEIITNYYYKGT